jgi:hypothetical protein
MEQIVNSIALVVGALLSLFASYFPGFSAWFENLESAKKQLVMLGTLFVVTFGAYGLSFTGYLAWFTPDFSGFADAVVAFVLAMIANQGMYKSANYIVAKTR